MFSYLRSHHKRSGSTPSSPDIPTILSPPAAHSSTDLTALPAIQVPTPDFYSYKHFGTDSQALPLPKSRDPLAPSSSEVPGEVAVIEAHVASTSPTSPHPPVLGPIARFSKVAQKRRQTSPERQRPNGISDAAESPATTSYPPQSASTWSSQNLRPKSSHQSSSTSIQTSSASPVKPNPGFLSVAYDDARSRTPPTPFEGPLKLDLPTRRPTSPLPVPSAPRARPRLNLRNPMSLLLRRRDPQYLDIQSVEEAKRLGLSKSDLPDDYDPRIIGKGVHDFSAPRPPPKRVYTSPNTNGLGVDNGGLRPTSADSKNRGRGRSISPFKHKRAKTPSFVEHFDDQTNANNNVRAEELANNDFLARNPLKPADEKNLALPSWVKRVSGYPSDKSPSRASQEPPAVCVNEVSEEKVSLTPPGPLGPTPKDELGNPISSITVTPEVMKGKPSGSQKSTAFTSSPNPRRRKSRFGHAHLTSNASRFSFQYAGPDSHLQEKLLEERHKVKAQEAAMAAKLRQEQEEFEDDDVYDEDEGLYEEAIPGVNADYDDDDDDDVDDGFTMPEGMGGGVADSCLATPSLEPLKVKEDNPLGAQSVIEAQRMALRSNPPSPADCSPVSLDSRSLRAPSAASARPSFDRQGSGLSVRGRAGALGDMGATPEGLEPGKDEVQHDIVKCTSPLAGTPMAARQSTLEDDMYFDDGLIEDPGDEAFDSGEFDESQFDDPENALYERQPVRPPPPPPIEPGAANEEFQHPALVKSQRVSVEQAPEASGRRRVTSLQSEARPFSGTSQQFKEKARKSHLSDYESIDAYHGALADAAAQAFADGRFLRDENVPPMPDSAFKHFAQAEKLTRDSGGSSHASELDRLSKPSMLASSTQSTSQPENRSSDLTQYSAEDTERASTELDGQAQAKNLSMGSFNGLRIQSLGSDFNWNPGEYAFQDDDAFDGIDDDDQIIAAANAEALANDDEGEYGREFGFYSAPPLMPCTQSSLRGRSSGEYTSDESDAGSDSEYANGGYFGPAGVDIVGRSKSTREPNLTPITERSEYSTRNSFISVGIPALQGGLGPVAGQSIAHLAMGSPLAWDDDEYERLLRLRHAAWGEGSRKSSIGGEDNRSIAGARSRDSSPVAAQSGGYLMPQAPIQMPIISQGNVANGHAVGWLNGVGVGISNSEALQRLGEDDESSSEDDGYDEGDMDVEGEQDSDYDANGEVDDRVYDDDEDSPAPGSPTVTTVESSSTRQSPTPAALENEYERGPEYFGVYNPSTPPRSSLLAPNYVLSGTSTLGHAQPHTPISPSSPKSPVTALKITVDAISPSNKSPTTRLSTSSPSPSPAARHSHSSSHSRSQSLQLKSQPPNQSLPHSPAHSRNSSANEGITVTYVKEKDAAVQGGTRWVLERRRTEANGDVTVLGREVVTGGRI